MKLFGTATLIAVLLISKCHADFVLGYFYDYYTATTPYSVAVPDDQNQNCTAWQIGQTTFDQNAGGLVTTFFSLNPGLCNYDNVMDFYFHMGANYWEVYEHDAP